MENEYEAQPEEDSRTSEKNLLRLIFLNLFIIAFITICYYYTSELFGSISTIYVQQDSFKLQFGITLLIFTLLCKLAGYVHGFVAGFLGECLFQLAFYDQLIVSWCLIVAIYGFLSGLYKYRPLKYKDGMKVYYNFMSLLIGILFTAIIITIVSNSTIDNNWETLIINYGFSFFLQGLISVIFLVPLLLFLYDYILARKQRHIYHLLLTHHPVDQADHTFYLKFGRTYFYFCSRCSGVMIGGMISYFITDVALDIYDTQLSPELAVLLCILLPIPGLVDWGTQRLQLRTSTTETRLMTGFVLGSALHFLSYTRKYYFFMLFILILYFTIFGLMMYFGNKRALKKWEEEYESRRNAQNQPERDQLQ